jgi:hypothetical protein
MTYQPVMNIINIHFFTSKTNTVIINKLIKLI